MGWRRLLFVLLLLRMLCYLILAFLGLVVYYNLHNISIRFGVANTSFIVYYVSLFIALIFDLLLLIVSKKNNLFAYRLNLATLFPVSLCSNMSMLFAGKVMVTPNRTIRYGVPPNPIEWIPIFVTVGIVLLITLGYLYIFNKHKDEIKNIKTNTMAIPDDSNIAENTTELS